MNDWPDYDFAVPRTVEDLLAIRDGGGPWRRRNRDAFNAMGAAPRRWASADGQWTHSVRGKVVSILRRYLPPKSLDDAWNELRDEIGEDGPPATLTLSGGSEDTNELRTLGAFLLTAREAAWRAGDSSAAYYLALYGGRAFIHADQINDQGALGTTPRPRTPEAIATALLEVPRRQFSELGHPPESWGIYVVSRRPIGPLAYVGTATGARGLAGRLLGQHLNPRYLEARPAAINHARADHAAQLEHGVMVNGRPAIEKSRLRFGIAVSQGLAPGEMTVAALRDYWVGVLPLEEEVERTTIQNAKALLTLRYEPTFNAAKGLNPAPVDAREVPGPTTTPTAQDSLSKTVRWDPPAIDRALKRPAEANGRQSSPAVEQHQDAETEDLGAVVIGSPLLAGQRRLAGRATLDDDSVARLINALAESGGVLSSPLLMAKAGLNAARARTKVEALRSLLNVDGYEVIAVGPQGEVRLNAALLRSQFADPDID